jgi:hypothetical protein
MSESLSATITGAAAPNLAETKAAGASVSRASGTVVSLAPFLALARELAAEIVPVRLRIEFRDELQRELMAAARQQYARDLLIWSTAAPPHARSSRRWIWGAATVGLGSAVSVASIVTAYYMRHRHRQAA